MLYRFIAAGLLAFTLAACSSLVPPPPPTLRPQEVHGRNVFDSYCSRCHDLAAGSVLVGPSMAGVAGRAGERVPGLDAEAYIRQSIMDPKAYTVEGFTEGLMPEDISTQLGQENLDAVVAFLLTLK